MNMAVVMAMLLASGCGPINSGVPVTSSFQAARALPPEPPRAAAASAPSARPAPVATTISPSPSEMVGSVWEVAHHVPNSVYRVPTRFGRATTIMLGEGERYNGNAGGNTDGFMLGMTYAASRPVISVSPRYPGAHTNLQIFTTAKPYLLELVPGRVIEMVSFDATAAADTKATARACDAEPTPQGDYTNLTVTANEGAALPAWAPVKAWADSYKLVVRFQGPLPVLPALFAGQNGEQVIQYRTLDCPSGPVLVTDRRVTEAQLRLDQEIVGLSATPPPPEANPHGWHEAAALPPAPPDPSSVAVFVMPGMDKDVEAALVAQGLMQPRPEPVHDGGGI